MVDAELVQKMSNEKVMAMRAKLKFKNPAHHEIKVSGHVTTPNLLPPNQRSSSSLPFDSQE
jgi:hypothetical protein